MKTKKISILPAVVFFSAVIFFALAFNNAAKADSECSKCDSDIECDKGMTCADCRSQEARKNCPGAGCSDAAGRCVSAGSDDPPPGGNNCDKIKGTCVAKTSDGKCPDGRIGVDYCDSDTLMCCGPGSDNGGGKLTIPTTGLPSPPGGIKQILFNLLDWVLAIIGIIALISFAVSGMQYFFAAGDEKIMETAKRNLTYSILGVIVVLSGFVVLKAIDTMLRGSYFGF